MELNKGLEDGNSNLLKSKIADLEKLKEDLKQAKDDAMQSWLDSRPLIDELEKMQEELASARKRLTKANTSISEIQAQIGTTDMCIKSAKEEELKLRTLMSDKDQDLHTTQEEMEELKTKIDQKRRRRSKLKQVLKIKKQSLLTLELTYEAVQLESEAFATSAGYALHHINNFEGANIMVRLTQEEYDVLKEEAREQTLLAERRIEIAAEEKLEAENSRDLTFRRLQRLYSHGGSSQRRKVEKTSRNENMRTKTEGNGNTIGCQSKYRRHHADANLPTQGGKRNPERRLNDNKYRYLVGEKKSSIFVRIKTFFARRLSKYFK